jgi:TolB-like protein/tetratricopeptide (TPR) repeat protein
VQVEGAAASGSKSFSGLKPGRVFSIASSAVALLAVAAVGFYLYVQRREALHPGAAIKSLVVLPFVNSSGDAEAEYLSDGITEGLINSLSQVRELQVIARSTAFRYKGKEVDLRKLGRDLSIDAVLTGRVQQLPDSLMVQADLVNVHTGSQLWGERYDRKPADISSMQQELTRSIAEKLQPRLAADQQRRVTKRETTSPEAYQLYLRGLYFRDKGTKESLEKSVDYFQQAIKLDSQYALSYAGLSVAYSSLAYLQLWPQQETVSKAEAAAQKALALDEELPEAHRSLGSIQLQKWNWSAAEAELKRAIALNPNDAAALNAYGNYLSVIRQNEEALAQYTRVQQLDPASGVGSTNMGFVLCRTGRYERGIAALKDALEFGDHGFPRFLLAVFCYQPLRMYTEAFEEARKAVALEPTSPIFLGGLACLSAQHGDRAEAVRILEELKKRDEKQDAAVTIAWVYTSLGDNDQAMSWLEKAYQRHSNWAIWIHFFSFDLGSDPRFADLLRRMGFPQ